jgi:ribose transport system permease protein
MSAPTEDAAGTAESDKPASTTSAVPPALARRRRAAAYAAPGLLVTMVVIFGLLRPTTFFTSTNAETILSSNSVLFVLTLSAIVTLVVGHFDLSIGAISGLAGVTTVWAVVALGLPVVVAIAGGIGIAFAFGLANAVLVSRMGLNSIVVTLGTSTLAVGVTQAITGGQVIFGAPESFTTIGRTELVGLRLTVWYAAVALVIGYVVLEHTPLGRQLYAVGANPEAVRLLGIPVPRRVFGAFVAGGVLAGLSGIMQVTILGSGHPEVGPPLLLPTFAAAFLGATTITPGRYNVRGSVVAVLFIATGVSGLQLLGVPFFIEPMFNGAALIAAVLLARAVAVAGVGSWDD